MGVDVVAALARSYLLEDLAVDDLERIVPAVRVRTLVRDEVLFHSGDPADELCVVVDGEVKDYVVTMNGEEIVHSVHGPGSTLGEPGFFSVERNRIVEVRGTRPTSLLVLGRPLVTELLERHPQLKDKALESLAGQARWQTSMIFSLATRPLEHRLLLRLLELTDAEGTTSTPEITQSTLAAMVGASREHVNRSLASLAARGIVRKAGNRYQLVDGDASRSALELDFPVGRQRDRRRSSEPPGP